MEVDGSDTESISSSISATTSSPGEHLQVKPLPGAKSKVWNYFGFVTNEAGAITNKSRVKCTIC